MSTPPPASLDELRAALGEQRYLADRGLATAVYLAVSLRRPLLLEGEAGVGKTEVAKAVAGILGCRLIRLQCHEGIDANQALYEWDYGRQLVHIRALSAGADTVDPDRLEADLFSPRFLLERPLLAALRAGGQAVLLVDELDRADDEFEAFLLEVLSDFQVTVPEIGTIAAETPPVVFVTSNRTREIHAALKRRCLYHWIDYPDLEREVEIVKIRAPEVTDVLARRVAAAVGRLRGLELVKVPGVAETIDWARVLAFLGATDLDEESATDTLGSVLKEREDLAAARAALPAVLEG